MVFRDCLKESKVSPGRRSPSGKPFHSRGPAAEKLVSPSLGSCVRGTSSFRMSSQKDRSGRRPTCAVLRPLQSIDIFCRHGAQQQTRRSGMRLANDGTYRQTDGHPTVSHQTLFCTLCEEYQKLLDHGTENPYM